MRELIKELILFLIFFLDSGEAGSGIDIRADEREEHGY